MKESRKEFIKELHSVVGTVWQTSIEKEFPKLFKDDDLVVGDWYRHYSGGFNYIVCVIDQRTAYGFMGEDYYSSLLFGKQRLNQGAVPATDEEVKDALIKEAKKRGFKNGVRIKSKWFHNDLSVGSLNVKFTLNKYPLTLSSGSSAGIYTIFEGGVWATVVETITKEEAEKELGKTILN
jgi:hypothetical protein